MLLGKNHKKVHKLMSKSRCNDEVESELLRERDVRSHMNRARRGLESD